VASNLTVVGILGLIVWCSWDYAGRYLNIESFLSFIYIFVDLCVFYSTYLVVNPEAEFLDEIQTKVLRVFLLVIHSHLYSFA
jgi:hypothetical protein